MAIIFEVVPPGGVPTPIEPPIRPPPAGMYNHPIEGAPAPAGPFKLKCPKTKMIRVFSNQPDEGTISVKKPNCEHKHRYWVDLEVVQEIDLMGAQWQGPDQGNLGQKTLQYLLVGRIGNYGMDTVHVTVKLGPGEGKEEKKAQGCEWKGQDDDDVVVHAKDCIKFVTRKWAVERRFKNKMDDHCGEGGNKCRNNSAQKWIVQFNNIDDDKLDNGQVPEIPQEYKNAVQMSADNSMLYLHVEIAKEVITARGRGIGQQKAKYGSMFEGNKPAAGGGQQEKAIDLPGAKSTDDKKAAHVRLDPYQMAVNFGPDGLAVELKASGNAGGGGGGGGGGGALGGALSGIAANMFGGASPAA